MIYNNLFILMSLIEIYLFLNIISSVMMIEKNIILICIF